MNQAFVRIFGKLHAPIYRRRILVLVEHILPHLRPGDDVLDVGCGGGALGYALLQSGLAGPRIRVHGLERRPRSGCLIPVAAYDGYALPAADRSLDVVVLADVLHHEPDPHRLLSECTRVTRRLIIIKDHVQTGVVSRTLLAVLDWAANAPHDVTCYYRYNSPADWTEWNRTHQLSPIQQLWSLRLYPPVVNLVFGNRLQYFAVLSPAKTGPA